MPRHLFVRLDHGSWLVALALSAVSLWSCADWSRRPIFPLEATGQPFVQEQAVVGVAESGAAAVAQLIVAEGLAPRLSLLAFSHDGRSSTTLVIATPDVAQAVAARVLALGRRTIPLVLPALAACWPELFAHAAAAGFTPLLPAAPEPGRRRWSVKGKTEPELSLRLADSPGPPAALVLLLAVAPGGVPGSDEIELARLPLAGAGVEPALWISGTTLWLQGGSVLLGASIPLHRTIAVRRASLSRGEAELHNLHGLANYSQGELDKAQREFDLAIAADEDFVDGLYNAASIAALTDQAEEAVLLLKRAAFIDPRRVQVLGRTDEDLKTLRKRPDVRALLGLTRLPPGD